MNQPGTKVFSWTLGLCARREAVEVIADRWEMTDDHTGEEQLKSEESLSAKEIKKKLSRQDFVAKAAVF